MGTNFYSKFLRQGLQALRTWGMRLSKSCRRHKEPHIRLPRHLAGPYDTLDSRNSQIDPQDLTFDPQDFNFIPLSLLKSPRNLSENVSNLTSDHN